jgi:cbb3-type cytochrome oxidase subunit 1
MAISKNFLVIGGLYLLVGIGFGMYMGASQDVNMTPVHAHLNLLGFVLMTLFGLLYRVMPELAGSTLAKVHFWLHQIGVLVLMVLLFLYLAGTVSEAGMVPAAPIAEVVVWIGVLCYVINLFRNLR